MADEKNDSKKESEMEKKLSYNIDFAWSKYSEDQKSHARAFAKDYMHFLEHARTERERVEYAESLAKEAGFKEITIGDHISDITEGDKVYYKNRKKNIAFFIIGDGSRPITEGVRFVGAHIDFPRVDLKIRPLYEDSKTGFALMKTHYYGGIKKFQYATIPMALTGVVIKKDGEQVDIEMGLDPEDPVLTIPDLLIHLGGKMQSKRKPFDVIKGEEMNVLVGALESEDENAKEKFKLTVLAILHDKYGITEDDFHSAELALVPALPPRLVGFDKSMVGAPGQDDGSCSFLGLRAILDYEGIPPSTIGTGLFDKEEIGSNGATGAQSAWIRHVITDLMVRTGTPETITNMHLCLSNSKILSADVTAALDPSFGSVHDPKTAAIFGKGIVLEKFTGSRGKYNTNDAMAEFMAYLRGVFDNVGVPFQVGTLGAVDVGGGGTIAKFFAQSFNCDVVDAGVALINMHSPFEIAHIADLYSGYLAYKAFFGAK